ncbi:hypothetical protein SCHPADRAFT_722441 [Schizopora paradoxa]|uniref:GDP/GTP exchange factor Sec2 N-terminal domain-containing protein n=1 Tax=Schizopora paradoxa TaxID=27342 RepID=A0A0H2R2F6_9AGAM|nr:hypothetical protein SCHPADRAFT_722441 [Schizopora paradoxa]
MDTNSPEDNRDADASCIWTQVSTAVSTVKDEIKIMDENLQERLERRNLDEKEYRSSLQTRMDQCRLAMKESFAQLESDLAAQRDAFVKKMELRLEEDRRELRIIAEKSRLNFLMDQIALRKKFAARLGTLGVVNPQQSRRQANRASQKPRRRPIERKKALVIVDVSAVVNVKPSPSLPFLYYLQSAPSLHLSDLQISFRPSRTRIMFRSCQVLIQQLLSLPSTQGHLYTLFSLPSHSISCTISTTSIITRKT